MVCNIYCLNLALLVSDTEKIGQLQYGTFKPSNQIVQFAGNILTSLEVFK